MKSGIVCVGRRALGERNEPRTHAPPPASDATSILQVNTLLSILRVCIYRGVRDATAGTAKVSLMNAESWLVARGRRRRVCL
jgi:hypothetical protein